MMLPLDGSPPLGMSEDGSANDSSIQVPPRTGVVAALCAPITPKCASRLTLPRTPPAMITTANPISSAALMLDIRLAFRWTGIVGPRGGDTTAAAAATTWPCGGVLDVAP